MLFLVERELQRRCASGDLATAARRILDEAAQGGRLDRVVLYFETRCAQSCEFCEQPRLRRTPADEASDRALVTLHRRGGDVVSSGAFDALCDAASQRTPPPTLTILGHDWAQHPHRDKILARLEREATMPVRLEGPSTALADPALAARVAALPTLDQVTLTLESVDPAVHDAIVGEPGACVKVMAAIEALRARRVRVHVNCVVTARAVPGLPALIAWLNARKLQVSLLGFIPDKVSEGWDGALLPRVDVLREALAPTGRRGVDTVAQVCGLPVCAVPPLLEPRVSVEWQSPVRERRLYADACEGCSARGRCGAVTEGYLAQHGAAGLLPR